VLGTRLNVCQDKLVVNLSADAQDALVSCRGAFGL
jgi:hypothetical protein